jgi:hypothetical protein
MPQSVTIRHALNIVLPVNGRVGNVRRTLRGASKILSQGPSTSMKPL